MTPQNAPRDATTGDEGDTTSGGVSTVTGRLWSDHATGFEMVLLPSRAPRENKYHRPGAPGSLLPACGTFDTTGVKADRVNVSERGYRPCRLCWPDADGGGR